MAGAGSSDAPGDGVLDWADGNSAPHFRQVLRPGTDSKPHFGQVMSPGA
jgi:hypothetical protein